MSDNLTKLAFENSEYGESLHCDSPHIADPDNPSLAEVLTVEKAQNMSEFFGFLADANRLRILSILAEKEMCVGDLAIALQMNESAVSHQLRTLRTIRFVNFRKQGRHVLYRLEDENFLDFFQSVSERLLNNSQNYLA